MDSAEQIIGGSLTLDDMAGYTYILRCSDGSLYVGSAVDYVERLRQHREGEGGDYTRRRRPVELVYLEEFPTAAEAFAWEKRLHKWSRAKKQAVIDRDFDRLPGLAKKPRPKAD